MNTINNHIATIQTLAASLTEAQGDQRQIDSLLDAIDKNTSGVRYLIEDAVSRNAKHIFKKIGKDAVTIRQLANYFYKGDTAEDRYFAGRMMYELRCYLQTKEVTGIIKNKQWYCTKETLDGYFRARILRDNEHRQLKAEQPEESLKKAA